MEAQLNAVETTGTVDEEHQLKLDHPLPISGRTKVRVIVMYPAEPEEFPESEWLSAAARSQAFEYLKEAREDIYTLSDGEPFHDEE